MYTTRNLSIFRAFRIGWKVELVILVVVSAVTVSYLELLRPHVRTSLAVVTVLGTAISFFIGFINSQAYSRWWEARKIWGAFVNNSRSFGRMVVTLLATDQDPEAVAAIQRRLIRRHIAYLYAVKERLRGEGTKEYLSYLSDEDRDRVEGRPHVGNSLLRLQGEDLDRAERAGYLDVIRLVQINDMLNQFSNSMGKAERIKLTVFPGWYSSLIRLAIWVFGLVFPAALSEQIGYWAIPYAWMLTTLFVLIYRAGLILVDPFENRPSDTPMSSIVRTIEINLLDQLDEAELPAPVAPVQNQYLM